MSIQPLDNTLSFIYMELSVIAILAYGLLQSQALHQASICSWEVLGCHLVKCHKGLTHFAIEHGWDNYLPINFS